MTSAALKAMAAVGEPMSVALGHIVRKTTLLSVLMNLDNRIAARYVFESRILIRFCRGSQKISAQGWARDLSESGLGAFAAENLVISELVTLQIQLGVSGKEVIAAKVSRQVGTQYGFQFTALSAEQRFGIQAALKGQTAIPYWQPSS
jgi:hypothetical protein